MKKFLITMDQRVARKVLYEYLCENPLVNKKKKFIVKVDGVSPVFVFCVFHPHVPSITQFSLMCIYVIALCY